MMTAACPPLIAPRRLGTMPGGAKNVIMSCLVETATMSANHSIKSEPPVDREEMGRVLPFEPRRRSRPPHPPLSSAPIGSSPVADIDKYVHRGDDDDEDYRRRMRANVAAVVVVGLLIWCGFWLFNTLAELRKVQDCVLSGRTNCVRIDVPPAQ